MRNLGENGDEPTYSGSLLLAHPELQDPNFRHAVVLLSAHNKEHGALGVVLNRPIGKTLGEWQSDYDTSPLADVPLYSGGPVSGDQMILTAWKFDESSSEFQLFFGLSPEKAIDLRQTEPEMEVRGFLGYSGWGEGQLEGEVDEHAWLITPIDANAIQELSGDSLWRNIVSRVSPELRFLTELPEDPSLN